MDYQKVTGEGLRDFEKVRGEGFTQSFGSNWKDMPAFCKKHFTGCSDNEKSEWSSHSTP